MKRFGRSWKRVEGMLRPLVARHHSTFYTVEKGIKALLIHLQRFDCLLKLCVAVSLPACPNLTAYGRCTLQSTLAPKVPYRLGVMPKSFSPSSRRKGSHLKVRQPRYPPRRYRVRLCEKHSFGADYQQTGTVSFKTKEYL